LKILSLDFGTSTLKAGFYFKNKISFYTAENHSYFDRPLLSIKRIIEKIKSEHKIKEIEAIVIDSIFPAYKFLDEYHHSFDKSFYWHNNNLGETISGILKSNFKIKYILPYKDYINFLLTSRISTDFITYYNLEREPSLGEFMKEFKDSLEPSEPVGFLNDNVKKYFGIKGKCVVLCGSIDAFVAALGVGAVGIGEAGEIGGTTTCVFKIVEKNSSEVPYFLEGQSIKILPMSCGGITLKWLKDTFKLDEQAIFEKIDKNQNRDEDLLFFPYLLGARSPIWSGKIRSAFYGIDLKTDFNDLLKVVVEGVAFTIKQNIDILKVENDWISISGQTALTNSWNQLKSNIYNLSLRRVNYLQSAVTGNIFLAVKFLSNFGDAEFKKFIKGLIKIETVFKPEKEKKLFYGKKYKNFIKMQDRFYDLKDSRKSK
jgi:sugar (pentulose or hexulose) kinase